MFDKVDLTKILFIDIETVSNKKSLSGNNEALQKLWHKKCASILRLPVEEVDTENCNKLYESKAAIYAEYGKIVCISVGLLYSNSKGKFKMRIKSFWNIDESMLLKDFSKFLETYFYDTSRHFFCGHNIKEFDVPFICRRMLICGVKLPDILNISGKKPWELKYLLDTLELWKFGDYKNFTSLNLLTNIFDIPTPKDDIDGSQVGNVYWEKEDLPRIVTYCEKDVLAVANLFLKLRGVDIIDLEEVEFVK